MSGIHLFTASLKKLPSLSPDGAAGWVQIRREPKATNDVCREALGGLRAYPSRLKKPFDKLRANGLLG
jgi:hypothetical protein